MSRKNWKLFIMCHNVIWDKMYAEDPDFSQKYYSFLKLGNHDLKYNPRKGYHIINEFDSPITLPKAYYAELTGMYCIYKNKLYEGFDYIGISHYDKEHRILGSSGETDIAALEASRYRAEVLRKQSYGPTDITKRIDDALNSFPAVHISLESHDFNKIYNQRVLMDKLQPDQFVGEGRNCFDEIVTDYNAFFGTNYSIEDVAKDGFLNMCNCFVTPVYLFEKLMSFVTQIIESSSLDVYDSQRLYRLQGGLLERYVAVFFALEGIQKIDLSITHRHWEKRTSRGNTMTQLVNKIKKHLLRKKYINAYQKHSFNKSFDWQWDKINYNRIALVNLLANKITEPRYLEIGCQENNLFNSVPTKHKVGVDPERGGNFKMTSDVFFASNNEKFDVIFIDGLHTYQQVRKDVINSLDRLTANGWIAMHDMLPRDWLEAHVPNISSGAWSGDVWKVAFELTQTSGIDFKIIKIDGGVGVIRPVRDGARLTDLTSQLTNVTFEYFYDNFDKLPVIEWHEAYEWIKQA